MMTIAYYEIGSLFDAASIQWTLVDRRVDSQTLYSHTYMNGHAKLADLVPIQWVGETGAWTPDLLEEMP
jgi:hypothetical protein